MKRDVTIDDCGCWLILPSGEKVTATVLMYSSDSDTYLVRNADTYYCTWDEEQKTHIAFGVIPSKGGPADLLVPVYVEGDPLKRYVVWGYDEFMAEAYVIQDNFESLDKAIAFVESRIPKGRCGSILDRVAGRWVDVDATRERCQEMRGAGP